MNEKTYKFTGEELKALLSSIPCGLCIYRFSGRGLVPLFHNPAFYEIMGCTHDYLASIGQNENYLGVHPQDLPQFQARMQEVLKNKVKLKHTCRIWNTKHQEFRWIQIEGSWKMQDNETMFLYCVFTDVSEQRRLEEYLQTVVKNLPGGIAVIRYEQDGVIFPEYMSNGFSEMVGMPAEDAKAMYKKDISSGIHPEDRNRVKEEVSEFIKSGKSQYKVSYRLKNGEGNYIWVRSSLSAIQSEGNAHRLYASFQDITADRKEQDKLLQQYNEKIIEHYHMRGADALIAGNCNITQDRIVEMKDRTDSGLLERFGSVRNEFFTGISTLIIDEEEQQRFRDTYLNAPALEAFRRGITELTKRFFVKMPKETQGRYLEFTVNMIQAPDTNDITGILTIMDITEQTVSDRILKHLSVASYDLVYDINLETDRYKILRRLCSGDRPEHEGCYSQSIAWMLKEKVLPKDKERVAGMLDPGYMLERLEQEGAYSFHYSILSEEGEVLTKNITVSVSDMRLKRVCLARADITQSLQEQQRLLNIIAYTFEVLAILDIVEDRITMYTRRVVLENLPPYIVENYSGSLGRIAEGYSSERKEDIIESFRIETMLRRLEQSPAGYDYVLPYCEDNNMRYKQVNVLWGDDKKRTICMVRADVTDMLAAEHKAKSTIEKALRLAEEANIAKSDFLSSMSHDIRTPINAITGMTTLAMAHLGEKEKAQDYLKKIVLSSKHLLSLINDILDMNKIERSKITLSREQICISELAHQVSDMIRMQAKSSGVEFHLHIKNITHPYFYGDVLRINQILINILSNAVKFTPEGGEVHFTIEEVKAARQMPHVRYLFQISDTGIGMSDAFLDQVFEPFARGRNVTKVEGSGLGLSIVKGLVDLMGGTVTVNSRMHKGTTFRIELEYEIARAEERDVDYTKEQYDKSLNEDFLKGRCFLLAEDNAINAEIICELLQMHGVRTMVKTDGVQVVQEFKNTRPGTYDAILMDIQMPFMNGYDATREIRKLDREDAKSIPIVAMTANAFEEDVREALAAGMDAHISKPIDMRLLFSTLGKLLCR